MKPDPAVSVLLPCRDAASFLPECLASLQAQTLREIEFLAVDDGSRDATPRLLQAWAARDPRVRVLGSPGRGIVPALRAAADAARAPLLARMDADDVALPDRLALQRAFLLRWPGFAACGTGVSLYPPQLVGPGYRRYETWINGLHEPGEIERDLFVECPVAHPSLMIRSEALEAVGGYLDPGWPEDYDLLLRLHAAGRRVANLEAVLLRWRVHPHRHSLRSERYAPAAFRRCKVHWLRTAFLPRSRPVVVWGAGRVGKALARELLRQGIAVEAFVDLDRRKIGQTIHGAPVLAPEGIECVPEAYVLVAVGSPGAREEIRTELLARGRREIDDFRVCA